MTRIIINIMYFIAAFLTQTVMLDDITVKFEIWDTAGEIRLLSVLHSVMMMN